MLVRMNGRMPYEGCAAVDSQVSPSRKGTSPICRMAGMPETTKYTVISKTQPTVTNPSIRNIPWTAVSSSCFLLRIVNLPPQRPRRTEEELRAQCPWAACGRGDRDHRNVVTSLELDSAKMEENNHRFQRTYRLIEENEIRFKEYYTEDAEYLIVAFGSIARICLKAIEEAREAGIKIGLLRPITLWPFPTAEIARLSKQVRGILTVELNAGQMVEDVRLAAEGRVPVFHFGRMGGMIPNPTEVLEALKNDFPELR